MLAHIIVSIPVGLSVSLLYKQKDGTEVIIPVPVEAFECSNENPLVIHDDCDELIERLTCSLDYDLGKTDYEHYYNHDYSYYREGVRIACKLHEIAYKAAIRFAKTFYYSRFFNTKKRPYYGF